MNNKNNKEEISKFDFINLLKISTWINGTIRYNKNNMVCSITLGEKMTTKRKTNRELLEQLVNDVSQLKTDVSSIDSRLKNVEDDIAILKIEAVKHGWDLSPNNK